MTYQLVQVWAIVPDAPSVPGSPPGIWGGGNVPMPSPPIANVPGAPGYEPPGGQPPGIWGPPGPWPSPPINLPPGVGSGNPPGIWGPNDPRPTPPIYIPTPQPPSPGVPTHPIYNPPGIWGPNDPRPGWGLPPEGGEGGGGQPPGFWGGSSEPFPTPPMVVPPVPPLVSIIDPDNLPEHPELPDLNCGIYANAYINDVMWPVFVQTSETPEGAEARNPVNGLPGAWKPVVLNSRPYWGWIPSPPE